LQLAFKKVPRAKRLGAASAGFKRSVAGVWRKPRLARTAIGEGRAADVDRATPSSRRRVDGVAKDAAAATLPKN